jgi:5'-3' exonuclease
MEADDKVSIRSRELQADGIPHVLATIDKDLDQVPCRHSDYKNHVFYDVGSEYAQLYFFAQALSGDSTDNIPGCDRIGGAKAIKMVEEWWNFAQENHLPTLSYVWDQVVETYAIVMDKYPDRYPEGMKPFEAALETARLVFMQEYEGQLWNPPGVPHGEVSSLAATRPAA